MWPVLHSYQSQKKKTRKLQNIILHERRHKNSQQIISKLNPVIFKEEYTP